MTKHLTQADLLKLVSNEDLPTFKSKLGIVENLTREQLVEEVERFSRSSILSALIAVNSDSIRMLSDIARFLEMNNIRLRTTGFTLALSHGIETAQYHFGPQLAGLLADFHQIRLNNQSILDWQDALQQWDSELKKWVGKVTIKGEPLLLEQIDIESWVINMDLGLPIEEIPYSRHLAVNSSDLRMLIQLWRTLDFLNHKLAVVSVDRSQVAGQLIAKLAEARRDIRKVVKRTRAIIVDAISSGAIIFPDRIYLKDMKPWCEDWSQDQLFILNLPQQMKPAWERWIAFIESILLLAEHQFDLGAAELFTLDLLKDRPRLFEVWLLTQIADIYRQRGYKIALSSIQSVNDQQTWWLNYTRGSHPVCEIQDAHSHWQLYYQWFVQGTDQANMPDIVLVDAKENPSQVIWIADPKYSEKGGYSRTDYAEVARRYERAFDAKAVWICEYFRRQNTFTQICEPVTEKAVIITDARPDGIGIAEIRRRIAELHWTAYPA